jgi:predicted DNA-binding ribbon-helix-helix protein
MKEVDEQNRQINVYLKIEEIDEAMRYKRNVSVFLNVQCNNFFTSAN